AGAAPREAAGDGALRLRRFLRGPHGGGGAGGRPERAAVPARRVGGGRVGGRRSDRAAGALLRVLAAAAAGRVRDGSPAVGRGAGVSGDGARAEPVRARRGGRLAARAAGARSIASCADRDPPRARTEIGPRATGDAEIRDATWLMADGSCSWLMAHG